MIRNLIFDLGGVLVSLNRERCLDNFSKLLGFDDFGEYLNSYAQKGFFAKFESGEIDTAQFREEVRSRCAKEDVRDEEIDYALHTFLTHVDTYKVKLLLELKQKYNLLLLSNVNPIAWSKCCELFLQAYGVDIEDVFENLYLSYKMNCSKPDRIIFKKLLADSSIIPDESLFIDDAAANIEAASEFGIHGLLYNVDYNLEDELYKALQKYD